MSGERGWYLWVKMYSIVFVQASYWCSVSAKDSQPDCGRRKCDKDWLSQKPSFRRSYKGHKVDKPPQSVSSSYFFFYQYTMVVEYQNLRSNHFADISQWCDCFSHLSGMSAAADFCNVKRLTKLKKQSLALFQLYKTLEQKSQISTGTWHVCANVHNLFLRSVFKPYHKTFIFGADLKPWFSEFAFQSFRHRGKPSGVATTCCYGRLCTRPGNAGIPTSNRAPQGLE